VTTAGRRGIAASSRVDPEDEARRFIVWPHHPDAMRRRPQTSAAASVGEAVTWNVFRTLQLLPPAFWLRRLNASLGLMPPRPASTTADVRLWCPLQVPPVAAPDHAPLGVDVRVETEQSIWALLVCHRRDMAPVAADGVTDPLTMLAYAASWHAGRRNCYVGVVTDDPRHTPLAAALVRRYQLWPGALSMRMPRHAYDSTNVAGIGLTTWSQLVAILRDAASDDLIDPPEQAMAARTVDWCDRFVG
jgi:hypothetical protein